MTALTTSLKIDAPCRTSLIKVHLICLRTMVPNLLHVIPYLAKPCIAQDALQSAVLTLTHSEGWAALITRPSSAGSFLPSLPHQNFRQCQTTATSTVYSKAPAIGCSKQRVHPQHRGWRKYCCMHVRKKSFKPRTREWEVGFIVPHGMRAGVCH